MGLKFQTLFRLWNPADFFQVETSIMKVIRLALVLPVALAARPHLHSGFSDDPEPTAEVDEAANNKDLEKKPHPEIDKELDHAGRLKAKREEWIARDSKEEVGAK